DISRPATYQAVMDEFDTFIGLDRLFAVHLNDSKASLGSKKDRHEHIGEGRIGITGFKLIMNDPRLKAVPKVLETPKEKEGKPMDPINIKRLLDVISR
ncbi:MAG: TIM barrel protein, partial [Desulfobacterales bacterium]|nr:TIM barrel protein [Desulfobacterales bacterium]